MVLDSTNDLIISTSAMFIERSTKRAVPGGIKKKVPTETQQSHRASFAAAFLDAWSFSFHASLPPVVLSFSFALSSNNRMTLLSAPWYLVTFTGDYSRFNPFALTHGSAPRSNKSLMTFSCALDETVLCPV